MDVSLLRVVMFVRWDPVFLRKTLITHANQHEGNFETTKYITELKREEKFYSGLKDN
jgi:hypothetical protein